MRDHSTGSTHVQPLLPFTKDIGVYAIRNRQDGKVYVGSTAFSIANRWGHHRSFLRRGKHPNRYLQHAWNKHGEDAFEFVVLTVCDPELIVAAEQEWMDRLESADPLKGYNLRPTAHNNLGFKLSEETKAKMSVAQRVAQNQPGVREKKVASLLGHTVSQEARDKIAAARLGKPSGLDGEKNPRAKLTEEQVKEIRRLHVPHSVEWGCRALAKLFGVSITLVQGIVRGKRWKHLDPEFAAGNIRPDGRIKLTDEQVDEIRRRYRKSCRVNGSVALAREFGVGSSMVLRIVLGEKRRTKGV